MLTKDSPVHSDSHIASKKSSGRCLKADNAIGLLCADCLQRILSETCITLMHMLSDKRLIDFEYTGRFKFVLSLAIITLPPSPCGVATRTANHFTPFMLPNTQPHAFAHLHWHSLGAFRRKVLCTILLSQEYHNSRQASIPWTKVNGVQCELFHRKAGNTVVSPVQDFEL